MAIDTIGTNALATSAVTTAKIAADAVTSAKIPAGAVVASDVADGSVTTAKLADNAVTSAKALNLGRRNLFINGDMQIAQRGSSLAMAHDGNTSNLVVDRFTMALGGTHEQLDGTMAQVAEHPLSNGLAKSLKWTTGTAESSYDADEYVYFAQVIEAKNLQHLNFGTANAKSITMSFYVKSSITGTFAVGIYKEDSPARIFNKTYTISSANTWEKKEITFAGDTAGGGIANDNGRGFYVNWHLSAGANAKGGGSTSGWKNYAGLSDWADGQATNAVMTTGGATWQMTLCQMEVGDTATDFEHRSTEEELAACQRYFIKSGDLGTADEWYPGVATYSGSGRITAQCLNDNEDRAPVHVKFPSYMRGAPTIVYYPGRAALTQTAGSIAVYNGNTAVTTSGKPLGRANGLQGYFQGTSTDAAAYVFQFTADAEL